jgi:hypothetical protein
MPKKNDLPKRQSDRKSPWGGSNLVWSLIAVGVAGLFAMSLVATPPEIELSYSDLEKLIRAADARRKGTPEADGSAASTGNEAPAPGEGEPAGVVEVVERNPFETGPDARRVVRYGDLEDVVIGAYNVTGSVRRLDGPAAGGVSGGISGPRSSPARTPRGASPNSSPTTPFPTVTRRPRGRGGAGCRCCFSQVFSLSCSSR